MEKKLVDTLQARNQLLCGLGTKMCHKGENEGFNVYVAHGDLGAMRKGSQDVSEYKYFASGNLWSIE